MLPLFTVQLLNKLLFPSLYDHSVAITIPIPDPAPTCKYKFAVFPAAEIKFDSVHDTLIQAGCFKSRFYGNDV
jgi:hypothetical protein